MEKKNIRIIKITLKKKKKSQISQNNLDLATKSRVGRVSGKETILFGLIVKKSTRTESHLEIQP